MTPARRLAAIVAVDVVGYSRLMAAMRRDIAEPTGAVNCK
jgi:class 3 adenylate cyclase